MNTIFGTVLRVVGAAVTSTVRPAAWTNTSPAVNPPVGMSTTRADGRYDLDPFSEMPPSLREKGHYEHYRDTIVSEMEKGRMLEWWILIQPC
jgi:hypothetical protein